MCLRMALAAVIVSHETSMRQWGLREVVGSPRNCEALHKASARLLDLQAVTGPIRCHRASTRSQGLMQGLTWGRRASHEDAGPHEPSHNRKVSREASRSSVGVVPINEWNNNSSYTIWYSTRFHVHLNYSILSYIFHILKFYFAYKS